MNSESHPAGIWRRPWSGPASALAWVALLSISIFVIFLGTTAALGPSTPKRTDLTWMALASVLLASLLAAASLFVRRLCCWRNLRRFLLGIVGILVVTAVAYAWENWRGKRAWQQHRSLLEAKGERLTISSLVPPAIPEERNFALAPLLRPVLDYYRGPAGLVWRDTNGLARLEGILADLPPHRYTNDHLVLGRLEAGTFADMTACALFYSGNTNYPQAADGAAPAQVILTALGRFAPVLKELREAAAARPDSRFPIHYEEEPSWGILLPHLARVKGLTLLSQVRATAALEAGQPTDAFDDLRLGLRLSDSIRDEPLLIDHLVRMAALSFDLQTAREGLDFLRRQRSDPMDYVGSEDGSASTTPPFRLLPSGFFYRNMLTLSRFFEDFTLPAVDERSRRVSPDLSVKGQRALDAMGRGPYTYIAKLLLPALQNAAPKSARMQTFVDATRVACALERYRLAKGRLPASLDGLVPRFIAAIPGDVIDGKPLRYRLNSDGGFVLYSVGWNQTDEGGQMGWAKQKKDSVVDIAQRELPEGVIEVPGKQKKDGVVDIAQGDWVWRMAAR